MGWDMGSPGNTLRASGCPGLRVFRHARGAKMRWVCGRGAHMILLFVSAPGIGYLPRRWDVTGCSWRCHSEHCCCNPRGPLHADKTYLIGRGSLGRASPRFAARRRVWILMVAGGRRFRSLGFFTWRTVRHETAGSGGAWACEI